MLPTARLGKRSPFGALVSSTWSATAATHPEAGAPGVPMETAPGQCGGGNGRKGQPAPKVYFQRGGESAQADGGGGGPACSSSRPSSSSIAVPMSGRSQPAVDMDELMAAMVLSSLSCSPQLHSPAHPYVPAPAMDGGGELSDGDSSGYWSVGHAHESPASSPPIAEADGGRAASADEGLDMELEQVLFDEPAPHKRRNSLKTAFRCLWPSCGKVLTSTVGIKRHIRTTHLGRGGEHERCSRSEEDFYYTEITQREWLQPQAPPPPAVAGPAPMSPSPPPSPVALSRSAPSSSSSLWQVQSEHSYQAPPPSHVSVPAVATPCSRSLAPPTSCNRQGLSFRVRSVSVGEQWLQNHNAPCRRIRGEAKKCRKVYGIEHREQWCTACRWKKACQRFLD